MADINIQRKKNTPSPWLFLLVVLAVVGLGAYFLFRAEVNAPPTLPPTPPPPARRAVDSLSGAETGPRPAEDALNDMAAETAPVTAGVLAAFAATEATRPDYGREGLRLLTSALVSLTDRDDLRTPFIGTRRDDLTSATSRLEEPAASLRPGCVAAAALVQAIQQQGYPELQTAARQLSAQAAGLSGRATTATEQQALRTYFQQAAELLRAFESPSVAQ
ncbi:hypothetical protein [Hymenobacter rubripertinctus]|uniref:Uncharacterized protein n=1 Tax=Hymenobacter rubripertinctus TaxID=2029981 RepID=A0A418R5Y1_9BACT|nr:hypothetical protein [Hymenobacter rubripertinctus]RIY12764.1 hypothetical protein D0T11_03305 [Hymenobacter rubripertinctus]